MDGFGNSDQQRKRNGGNSNPGNSNPGNANPGYANPGNANGGNSNPGNSNDQGNENPGFYQEDENYANSEIPMKIISKKIEDSENGKISAFDPNEKNSDQEYEEIEQKELDPFMRMVEKFQRTLVEFYEIRKNSINSLIQILILLAFHAFLGMAIWHGFHKAVGLLVLTLIGWVFVFYFRVVKPFIFPMLEKPLTPLLRLLLKLWSFRLFEWAVYLLIVAALVVFLVVDTKGNRWRLVSLAGLAVHIIILFLFSTNPAKVRWRPVIWGIALQFIFGLLILRWSVGQTAFGWLSDKVTGFLGYVDSGTSFVYGFLVTPSDQLQQLGALPVFAFATLPVVLFFSSFVSILYYLGVMQFVIVRLGWLMQMTMGTTAAESLNAAGNIFIGQTEAPLMVRPYMHKLTKSEIHAIMTGGFATIAGSVFAAYVRFGACASQLLSASIMSAPAALAVSKLFYPETEKSNTKDMSDLRLEKGQEKNVIEAASNGASQAIFLLLNIIANLIVFLSFLAFANDIVGWLGEMIGVQCLSFEKIMSWVFFPLAYVMGASSLEDPEARNDEILKVAELMGIKTILNEFIAYQKLGVLIQCGKISKRAQLIATYALCGFSNISSLGIQIGGLSAMCQEKRSDIAQVAVRALIAGSMACFMTACVAGVLAADIDSCGLPQRTANCELEFSPNNTQCN